MCGGRWWVWGVRRYEPTTSPKAILDDINAAIGA